MKVLVPSKTFLVGEYAALIGGPALVLATEPAFALTESESAFYPHPASPAGKIWKSLPGKFSFIDPFNGEGGFGASGAQFLSAKRVIAGRDLIGSEIFSEYGEIQSGSGYDVIAQLIGRVAHINSSKNVFESLKWPFPEFDFLIFKTGYKIATHEAQNKNIECAEIADVSASVVRSFLQKNPVEFIEGLFDFREILERQGLVLDTTQAILEDFERDDDVLVSKGCGAMGADVVLAIVRAEKSDSVRQRLGKKLRFVASSKNISNGLRVETTQSLNDQGGLK